MNLLSSRLRHCISLTLEGAREYVKKSPSLLPPPPTSCLEIYKIPKVPNSKTNNVHRTINANMCNMHTPAEPHCFHREYKDKKSKDPAVLICT